MISTNPFRREPRRNTRRNKARRKVIFRLLAQRISDHLERMLIYGDDSGGRA